MSMLFHVKHSEHVHTSLWTVLDNVLVLSLFFPVLPKLLPLVSFSAAQPAAPFSPPLQAHQRSDALGTLGFVSLNTFYPAFVGEQPGSRYTQELGGDLPAQK